MDAWVELNAGECGFQVLGQANCEDNQHVTFELTSNCNKICNLGKVLKHADPIDAYAEVAPGAASRLHAICSEVLTGCCAGCVVPTALFKVMQVAAGLSLPRDITIRLKTGQP